MQAIYSTQAMTYKKDAMIITQLVTHVSEIFFKSVTTIIINQPVIGGNMLSDVIKAFTGGTGTMDINYYHYARYSGHKSANLYLKLDQ